MTTASHLTGDVYSGDCPMGAGRLAIGDVIDGKYEVVSFLGAGGMGSVWRAHSRVLDVDVAVKVLHGDHDGVGERLHREARATAQIGHPAIVRALDFGVMNTGEQFLVMELLEGSSLADWLHERGPVPAARAVQLLLPIADGLAAAHARGIVHRDVKPENIIVVPDPNGAYLPKIVDFGIAKLDTADGAAITQEGALLGSPLYMAPEQALGERATPQADVWALSVVLYELITGASPFQGPTIASVLLTIQTKPPRPAPELARDPELWAIIQRGLRKSLKGRWPTMRELGQALAAWALARGIVTDATGASIEHVWVEQVSGECVLDLAPSSEDRPSSPGALPMSSAMCRTLPSSRTTAPASKITTSVRHDDPSAPKARVTGNRRASSGLHRALRRGAMGLSAALIGVPVLGVSAFCAHALAVASTHVGARPALAAAALAAGPPAEMVAAAPPSPAAPPDAVAGPATPAAVPEEGRAPSAAVEPSARARRARTARVHRPKLPAPGMPLPTSPDF